MMKSNQRSQQHSLITLDVSSAARRAGHTTSGLFGHHASALCVWLLRSKQYTKRIQGMCFRNAPEPDTPKDVTPMAQCAFNKLILKVSADYIN